MKVLILSVGAGMGHIRSAEAISDKFIAHGHECEILDIFSSVKQVLGTMIQTAYLFSIKNLKRLYNDVYSKLVITRPQEVTSTEWLLSLVAKKLAPTLKDATPPLDLVISVHPFSAIVINKLRQSKVISCPAVGIVTDFTVQPFWEKAGLDYYIVANEDIEDEMLYAGAKKEQIRFFGIPIKKEFETSIPQKDARKKLGIDDARTVLLIMGSMGYGNIEKLLSDIDSSGAEFQVLCVCGTNTHAKKLVDKKHWTHKIISYGYVDNIEVMMDASDVVVTKPGGLSSSEILAKGIPMVSVSPIPGHEERNLIFLEKHGATIGANSERPIPTVMDKIFSEKEVLEGLKASAKKLGRPMASEDLCVFCEEICKSN